ncbi:MAG: outer membrane beta-barrel domain-containing protein [Bacteriovoracaceae bacterium]|nr:outer membrane beta-barrel domain-containing protein [Bacteriovoracaceae bacterium]
MSQTPWTRKTLSMFLALVFLAPTLVQASEDSLYDFLWLDPDKKVYVLQNKVYKKKGTGYVNAGYVMSQTPDFFDSTGWHLSTGWYFHEEWAIEGYFNTYSNKTNTTYENLKNVNGAIPFSRQFNKTYGLMAVWSPFYGKINTFNKIFYFDWSIGAGVAKIDAESNSTTAAIPSAADTYKKESYTGAILKTGLRFHATKRMHLDLNLHRTIYQAPGPVLNGVGPDKWWGNTDVVFSVGFSF